MKIIIKELGASAGGYPHCFRLDTNEMFVDSERRYVGKNFMFILSCDTCPTSSYASVVSFYCGIHTQLMRFLNEFGPSTIIYRDKEFFIDVRQKEFQSVDKEFKTFREAFAYCMMEDAEFWDNDRLEEGTKLADLH